MDNLAEFVQRIIRPVIVDGNHPVDYAPTQIITEAFRWWSKPKIDGIAYRSLNGGGTNVVLFYGEAFWFESDSEKGTNMDRIERDTERDNFMSAEDAVKYGLIDKVLSTRDSAAGKPPATKA